MGSLIRATFEGLGVGPAALGAAGAAALWAGARGGVDGA
jgi:hypothetical protein